MQIRSVGEIVIFLIVVHLIFNAIFNIDLNKYQRLFYFRFVIKCYLY